MNDKESTTRGWGETDSDGMEMWDAEPTFAGPSVRLIDKLKLIFYPKKFFLYRYVRRAVKAARKEGRKPRIVDIGCGTGGAVIDFKKLFGRTVEVVGLDVVQLQIDVAKQKIKEHGVWAEIMWFDGKTLPFGDESVDVIYSSDVLGHVQDVPAWLDEVSRVMKAGGTFALFSESKLGKHAYIRRYLFDKGINTDPHAEYHISLYSKDELKDLIGKAGFVIHAMYSSFWATFLVHPDEMYEALRKSKGVFLLKWMNAALHHLKKATHPVSTAAAELYGLVEMMLVGRWIEAQGYIIHARKERVKEEMKEREGVVRFNPLPASAQMSETQS